MTFDRAKWLAAGKAAFIRVKTGAAQNFVPKHAEYLWHNTLSDEQRERNTK